MFQGAGCATSDCFFDIGNATRPHTLSIHVLQGMEHDMCHELDQIMAITIQHQSTIPLCQCKESTMQSLVLTSPDVRMHWSVTDWLLEVDDLFVSQDTAGVFATFDRDSTAHKLSDAMLNSSKVGKLVEL